VALSKLVPNAAAMAVRVLALVTSFAVGLCPCAAISIASVRHTGSSSDALLDSLSKNPIRKVVNLLEGMAKKVAEEGEQEKDLYEKFACYCKTGAADLEQSISGNNAKVPQVQSDIEQAESTVAQLKLDLTKHQADRSAANTAMAEATSLREKEHAAFLEESTELKGYVNALAGAIPQIMSGMAGTRDKASAQLQLATSAVAILRKAATGDMSITEDDKSTVMAFLSSGSSSGGQYIPASLEIVGILKTMHEDFASNLAEVTAVEEEAVKLFDQLIDAKTKEVHALGSQIEKKTARVGDLGVEIVTMKQELTTAEAMLIADNKFLGDLSNDCEGKQKEMDERVKVRNDELQAIHQTIKILNDDDSLDLFKKTLSSSSLLQLASEQQRNLRQRALAALKTKMRPSTSDRPEIRFLALALQGGKVDFSKVIKMIDDMVALLGQEQSDDDFKLEYCRMQIDNTEDKAKDLKKNIDELEVTVEDKTEAIATYTEELKTMQAEIEELDRLVLEATVQRKRENEEFTGILSENNAAVELLDYAKNRLQKFYSPKLYKPKEEEEPASFLQMVSANIDAPEPAPETWSGAYSKKSEESGGVIGMIDLLIRDLTKEITVAETDEEHAQREYEGFMDESAGKRAKAVKGITIKQAAKADSEVIKTKQEGELTATTGQFQATNIYMHQLHTECDWLIQNYDLRKTARAEERDNLKNAKAVLKGADFSLVQVHGGGGGAAAQAHAS